MSAKITASADGSKVTIGNAAEDALLIDTMAKTITAVGAYSIPANEISGGVITGTVRITGQLATGGNAPTESLQFAGNI